MRRTGLATLVALLAIGALPWLARGDGIVILDVAGNTGDAPSSLANSSDGRLYVTTAGPAKYIFAFDAAGEAVSAFGTNGRVVISDDVSYSIRSAVRSDGAVVTLGHSLYSASNVFIHSSAGALQSELHLPSIDRGDMIALSLAVQPDDFSVFGGYLSPSDAVSEPEWALARVRPDGLLDTTFGGGTGWITKHVVGQAFFGPESSAAIATVRIQPDGKILAASWGVGPRVLGRFNTDGSTDFAFGTNGLVTLACPFSCIPALDSVGRIYVEGDDRLLMRLNADGSPDPSYASVARDFAIRVRELAVDSADRVVVFGTFDPDGEDEPGIPDGYLARFLPSGARDPSFGSGGEVHIHLPAQMGGQMVAGIVLPNDKLVTLLNVSSNIPYVNSDIGLVQLTEAGALDVSFGANDVVPDVYPDPFAFADDTAPFGTTSVVSDTVTISGINTRTDVYLVCTPGSETRDGCLDSQWNGAFSIGCTGTFVTTAATLLPGDTLCLRHRPHPQPGGVAQTSVRVGGRLATYMTVSTSEAADTQPDNFAFVDQSGVTPGATVTSNAITITGLTGAAPVVIVGGSYSVGCEPQGFTTSNGFVTNGQTICVSHVASSQRSAAVNTTLAIGGVTDTFTSTSAPPDPTPPPTAGGGGGGGALSPKDVAALLLLLLAALRKCSQVKTRHPSLGLIRPMSQTHH
jgi:uncharacterized delta-60 repeat protein